MPDDYRISDLSTAPSIGNSDLMELSVVNSASDTGYTSMKAPVLNLANKIVNETQYVSDLQTQNKTITGAINEIAQGGGGGGGDADVIKTASGSIASFTTNLEAKLPALKANFLCSGGNGTPSTPIPLVPLTELNVVNKDENDVTQDSITIDLDGTRYGGYVDANNGKLVVTWGIVDLGSLDYVYSDSGFSTQLPNNAKELNSNADVLNSVCDSYVIMSWNDATYNKQSGIMGTGVLRYIVIYNSDYSDAVAFKTAMSEHYFAYELATPIEVDISPEYLNAHTGVNNVFHDGNGTVELSYFTDLAGDIKSFINADVGLDDLDDVVISSPSANQVLKYDGNKWVNGTGGGGGVPWVEITGTLLAGNVILLWASNPNIHADSTVDIYVDTAFYGVAPLTVALSEGNLTLTFEPQSADMPVKVRLS